MKRLFALSVCLFLLLSGCGTAAQSQVNTSSVSSQSTISSSDTKAPSAIPKKTSSISDEENLIEIAKALYTGYLEECKKTNKIQNYRIDDIKIEYMEKDEFEFSVHYDVLNPDVLAGNGTLQSNGWVTKKYAYVKAVKSSDNYIIESQGTGIIAH
jgi:hypothetical protein